MQRGVGAARSVELPCRCATTSRASRSASSASPAGLASPAGRSWRICSATCGRPERFIPTSPPGRSAAACAGYGSCCVVIDDRQRRQIEPEAGIAGTDATDQYGPGDADQSHHEPPTTQSFRAGAGSRNRASVRFLIGTLAIETQMIETHGRFLVRHFSGGGTAPRPVTVLENNERPSRGVPLASRNCTQTNSFLYQ
jgi:hypothetical protein